MGGISRSHARCASTHTGSSSGCSGSVSAHLLPTNSPTVLPTCSPYFLELSRTSTASISTFSRFPMHFSSYLCSFRCSCNFSNLLYFFYSSPTFCAIPTSLTLSHFSYISHLYWKVGESFFFGGGRGNPGKRQGNCR